MPSDETQNIFLIYFDKIDITFIKKSPGFFLSNNNSYKNHCIEIESNVFQLNHIIKKLFKRGDIKKEFYNISNKSIILKDNKGKTYTKSDINEIFFMNDGDFSKIKKNRKVYNVYNITFPELIISYQSESTEEDFSLMLYPIDSHPLQSRYSLRCSLIPLC